MPQPAQPATKSPQRPRSKTRLCRSGGGLQNITFSAMLCFIRWIEQGKRRGGFVLARSPPPLCRVSPPHCRGDFPRKVLRAAIPLERWFGIKSGFAVSPTPAAPCEFRRPSHCGYFKPVFPGSRFVCYSPPPAPKGGAWALDKQRSFCGLFLRRPPWEVWATDKQNFPRKGLDKLHIACYYNNRGRRINVVTVFSS